MAVKCELNSLNSKLLPILSNVLSEEYPPSITREKENRKKAIKFIDNQTSF